jgi:probable F420-dependent oxidoreductase
MDQAPFLSICLPRGKSVRIDANLISYNLNDMVAYTRAAEAMGFDGIWTAETRSDPFLPLVLAAEHSRRMNLGTAIAVAFPRSPAILAYIAWDLARYSRGRFILGLGSQVRGHIERRFGVKWEKPIQKMRETVLAIRAFWDCWQHGTKLNFKGEFHRFNLMTPFFSPGAHDYPDIPIYVSAINRLMLQVAGEVCDGVLLHVLHTVPYLKEFALPQLQVGLDRSGRTREQLSLATSVFVIPNDDPKLAASAEAYVRSQLSFYMSTPAYKVVLELHGWGALSERLGRMARGGEWNEMPAHISDEILEACAVTGSWAELPCKIQRKYGDLLDRVSYYLPYVPGEHDEGWRRTVEGFRQLNQGS